MLSHPYVDTLRIAKYFCFCSSLSFITYLWSDIGLSDQTAYLIQELRTIKTTKQSSMSYFLCGGSRVPVRSCSNGCVSATLSGWVGHILFSVAATTPTSHLLFWFLFHPWQPASRSPTQQVQRSLGGRHCICQILDCHFFYLGYNSVHSLRKFGCRI